MKLLKSRFDALRISEYWPLMASTILILAFQAGFYWRHDLQYVMCSGTEDEHCAREWVSALSGWAAFLAAIATVRFLKRQIEESNRHQRENVELAIMGKISMAIECYTHCAALEWDCKAAEIIFTQGSLEGYGQARGWQFVLEHATETLQQIRDKLAGDVITRYELEIGSVGLTLSSALERLDAALLDLAEQRAHLPPTWKPDQAWFDWTCRDMQSVARWARSVAAGRAAHALEFQTKWQSRMNDGSGHSAASR